MCGVLLQVRLTDKPKDSGLLETAVTAALTTAASRLPSINRMALITLQEQSTTSLSTMMTAIQEQLAVPHVVIFSEMEVSGGLPGLLRLQIHLSTKIPMLWFTGTCVVGCDCTMAEHC